MSRPKRARLLVEQLESREVPAAWVWVRPTENPIGTSFWTNRFNWLKDGNTPQEGEKPGENDDVTFDGANGTSTASKLTEETTVKTLTITTGYTNAIDLDQPLVVKTTASLAGDPSVQNGSFTITGDSNLQIGTGSQAATFSIDGGIFKTATIGIELKIMAQASGEFVGKRHDFDTRNLANFGTISWKGGDFQLSNEAQVKNHASFDITNANTPTFFGQADGKVINETTGTMSVNFADPSTSQGLRIKPYPV